MISVRPSADLGNPIIISSDREVELPADERVGKFKGRENGSKR